ncbi:hypothetical protein RJD38_21365 (plasmid) [Vibrio scophthalmi]|uniref:hypothetical protein n=1 Tax=Vibrio scophthalmi TaxID=45658 RepID=UPI000809835B|nr:hypothetical protein [Vibrio scophthalmi]ANS88178.1 hypothetical protein VSVS12_04480 [Vibrio scophthalmi]
MNRQQRQEKKAKKRARLRKTSCSIERREEDFVFPQYALTPPLPGVYVSLVTGHRLIVDKVMSRVLGRYQVVTKSLNEKDDDWNAIFSDMEWGALNHMSLYSLEEQVAA